MCPTLGTTDLDVEVLSQLRVKLFFLNVWNQSFFSSLHKLYDHCFFLEQCIFFFYKELPWVVLKHLKCHFLLIPPSPLLDISQVALFALPASCTQCSLTLTEVHVSWQNQIGGKHKSCWIKCLTHYTNTFIMPSLSFLPSFSWFLSSAFIVVFILLLFYFY